MQAAHSGAKVRAAQECQNQQSVKASDDSEPMPSFQALKKLFQIGRKKKKGSQSLTPNHIKMDSHQSKQCSMVVGCCRSHF